MTEARGKEDHGPSSVVAGEALDDHSMTSTAVMSVRKAVESGVPVSIVLGACEFERLLWAYT